MVLAIGSMIVFSLIQLSADPLQRSVYELAMAEAAGNVGAFAMRVVGYILPGLLILPVGSGLLRRSRYSRMGWLGAILLMLSGVAWALVGLFPPQFGDEPAMVRTGLLMLLFALSGGLALLLFAFALRWRRSWQALLVLSSLLVFASVVAASPSLPLPGLLERICFIVYFLWIGVLGTRVAVGPSHLSGDAGGVHQASAGTAG